MASFTTNPLQLEDLLRECEHGTLKLPDFQRSWVWDEERIRSLITSISLAFPVGALMSLETGGAVEFKARRIQGAPDDAETHAPRYLLLDGQQRMTSLYQTCMRRQIVETVTARQKRVKRWYYINIEAALDPQYNREDAVVGIPEDRIQRSDFGRTVLLDLSSPELEYEEAMFPVNRVFDWDAWQDGFGDHWVARGMVEKRELFKCFKDNVLQNFKNYQVPVIALDRETSREAVCLVFEKVNTGGKPLDVSTAAGICTGAAAQKCTTGSVVACPRSPWEGPARGATRPRRGWRRPARGRGLWAHGVKRGVIRTVAGVVTVSA